MKKAIPAALSKTGMDMSFAQINITRDDFSVTYIVPSDDAANEVIKTAFGDKTSFDGTSYRAEPNLSRKKDVAPAITGILEAHQK